MDDIADEIDDAREIPPGETDQTYGFFGGPGGTKKNKSGHADSSANSIWIKSKYKQPPGEDGQPKPDKPRNKVDMARTLVHEWTHVRQTEGEHPEFPDAISMHDAENDPCEHFKAYDKALRWLCDLYLNSDLNEILNPCDTPLSGASFERIIGDMGRRRAAQWSHRKTLCEMESWATDEDGSKVIPEGWSVSEFICF